MFLHPAADEIVWTRAVAGSDEHLLALVTQLKAFNRLGYFTVLDEVPAEVVAHIRRDLRLPETTMPVYASTRTAERHRNLVRARGEVVYDPAGARKVAADAIEEAARRKNDPTDPINIALERLVESSDELPAFRTLNDMATTIRARANEDILACTRSVMVRTMVTGMAVCLVSTDSQNPLPAPQDAATCWNERLVRAEIDDIVVQHIVRDPTYDTLRDLPAART